MSESILAAFFSTFRQIAVLLFLLINTQTLFAIENENCVCPEYSCIENCEVDRGLTFYSEKCAGGQKVMSCSRPKCEKVEGRPAHCESAKNSETAKSSEVKNPSTSIQSESNQTPDRMVASESTTYLAVGRVKYAEGSVKRTPSGQTNKLVLSTGDEVSEKDEIESDASGKAQIQFISGNILNITPNTKLIISDASDSMSTKEKQQMILDLIKGQVRSRVESKSKGKDKVSHYQIRTRAAVAGVRGTDFTVTAFENAQRDIVAKVDTVSGEVELSDRGFNKKVAINKGQTASFILPAKVAEMDKDKMEFVSQGYLTQVSKLSEYELKKLEDETGFHIAKSEVDQRDVASTNEAICQNPAGDFNQCSWICDGNPLGEKTCRTDLPGVSCTRRKCDANGAWSQPTRLPASYNSSCHANRSIVKPCDY